MSGTHATPEVTAVIPTRNRWSLLERALRTAPWQERVDLEVIVVDDGSTDETPDQLGNVRDPRVRVVRHESGRGLSAARNSAIRLARAPWLAFLDDDDLWAPNKLRSQVDAARDDTVLVMTGAVFTDAQGRRLHERLPLDGLVSDDLLSWNHVGSPSGVLARTASVHAVGGFDESLPLLEDWDLWLRLSRLGGMEAVRDYLYAYRLHAGASHARDTSELLTALRQLGEKLRAETPARELRVDRPVLARLVAGEQRRAGRRAAATRTYCVSGVRDLDVPNLVRGLTLLVGGERPLATARRLVEPRREPPAWLDAALRRGPL